MRYPIVQTGMGWVAGARLVAATANAGALGILASATMTFEELEAAVAEVRSRTDAPFGVNMRTDVADVAKRVTLLVDQGVRVASFAQAPRPDTVTQLRDAGDRGDPHRRGAPARREDGISRVSTVSSPKVLKAADTRARSRPRSSFPRSSTQSAPMSP